MNVKRTAPAPVSKPPPRQEPKPTAAKPPDSSNVQDDSYGPRDYHRSTFTANSAASQQQKKGIDTTNVNTLQRAAKDCGDAVLHQVQKSFDSKTQADLQLFKGELEKDAKQINASPMLQQRLQQKIDVKDGYTADEMGAMLGMRDIKVTNSFDNFDEFRMDEAIGKGQLGLALVDANVIANGVKPGAERGPRHWVTIDAFEEKNAQKTGDNTYQVRDPATNQVYKVSTATLKTAVEAARARNADGTPGSGGLLLVDKAPAAQSRAQREQLAFDNLKHTGILGKDNGGGSNTRNNGAETSYSQPRQF